MLAVVFLPYISYVTAPGLFKVNIKVIQVSYSTDRLQLCRESSVTYYPFLNLNTQNHQIELTMQLEVERKIELWKVLVEKQKSRNVLNIIPIIFQNRKGDC